MLQKLIEFIYHSTWYQSDNTPSRAQVSVQGCHMSFFGFPSPIFPSKRFRFPPWLDRLDPSKLRQQFGALLLATSHFDHLCRPPSSQPPRASLPRLPPSHFVAHFSRLRVQQHSASPSASSQPSLTVRQSAWPPLLQVPVHHSARPPVYWLQHFSHLHVNRPLSLIDSPWPARPSTALYVEVCHSASSSQAL